LEDLKKTINSKTDFLDAEKILPIRINNRVLYR